MISGFDKFLLFVCLALATYTCRAAGFWLMGLVKPTPRIEAALKAAPLAVMIGIVAPAALRGGIPETAGLLTAIGLTLLRRSELFATLAALVVVAGEEVVS